MAYFRDWVGFTQTVEQVEPDPETELIALEKLTHLIDEPAELAFVAQVFGLDHHLSELRRKLHG